MIVWIAHAKVGHRQEPHKLESPGLVPGLFSFCSACETSTLKRSDKQPLLSHTQNKNQARFYCAADGFAARTGATRGRTRSPRQATSTEWPPHALSALRLCGATPIVRR